MQTTSKTLFERPIVYFFMVFKNPLQVKHAIERLQAPNVYFYLHIDSKSKEDFSFAKSLDNVYLADRRYDIPWGGVKW